MNYLLNPLISPDCLCVCSKKRYGFSSLIKNHLGALFSLGDSFSSLAVMLFHKDSAVQWPVVFAVFAAVRRISLVYSLQRRMSDDAADTRQPIAAHSGTHRASRHAKVSIRRLLPCFPLVISAEVLH
jgi:hypothetical protein